jgi:hypothetical protein
MIGMQCAKAVDTGKFVAFVGASGRGADWPDPRILPERRKEPT